MKYKIEITSVPDREKMVAEIWDNDQLIAEINQEHGKLKVEFYLDIHNRPLSLDYNALLNALEEGKKNLLK